MIVVGIDQSLSMPGIAAVERRRDGTWAIREVASFATVADDDEDVRHADDDARRIRELFHGLEAFLVRHTGPQRAVGLERVSGAQSAAAMRFMSYAWATVTCLCAAHGIHPFLVDARAAKLAATGSSDAEKRDVVKAMRARWAWTPTGTVKLVEAQADALAVATVVVETVDARRRAA